MQLRRIIKLLENTYSGATWYGSNLCDVLTAISSSNPNASYNGGNSLGQILEHMIQWKKFVIEKINGNTNFIIEINSIQDWNRRKIYTTEEFIALIHEFKSVSEKLIEILKGENDELLNKEVPGKKYDFKTLLDGIVHHDIYHVGQLSLLKRG
ncbi:DinB family protein [Abyssalbus ytuae]|uniref:DinB family protein n=1 Tax=Abyssalbus ytuae TaxID=2926907 RepID=A0A9E6ZRS4_9FLAO|nr:DinB family protein [Abyssalbus ytuae]UOB17643.1 DinB family protein [Abyssalbus ytuae]